MKNFLLICTLLLGFFVVTANGIVLEIPNPSSTTDVAIVGSTQIGGDESIFFESIQMINKYLWMGLGLICMVLLVYSGIGLITANGDESKMKNANKTLMGALVGILISVFSFAIIRLLVNLFQ